jgi:hypothetical protein
MTNTNNIQTTVSSAASTRIIDTVIVDGITYSTPLGLVTKNSVSGSTLRNTLDEFQVTRLKIGKSLFYDTKVSKIVLDVLANKNKYLKEVVSKKIGELND